MCDVYQQDYKQHVLVMRNAAYGLAVTITAHNNMLNNNIHTNAHTIQAYYTD